MAAVLPPRWQASVKRTTRDPAYLQPAEEASFAGHLTTSQAAMAVQRAQKWHDE
jgi:hypothetical protein